MDIRQARREFKFRLSGEGAGSVMDEISALLPNDVNGLGGAYPIVSEYYDSEDRDAYWDRDRKVGNRRKLRVRIYGTTGGEIPPSAFLEVKHKRDGMGVKRRMVVPVEAVTAPDFEVGALINRLRPEMTDKLDQLLAQEILLLMPRVRPAMQMRYERIAFEGEDGVRVTFDSNVQCRSERLDLQPDDQRFTHVILPPGELIMEVKMADVVPYWLRDLVAKYSLNKEPVSKYCEAIEACDPVVAPLVARMNKQT